MTDVMTAMTLADPAAEPRWSAEQEWPAARTDAFVARVLADAGASAGSPARPRPGRSHRSTVRLAAAAAAVLAVGVAVVGMPSREGQAPTSAVVPWSFLAVPNAAAADLAAYAESSGAAVASRSVVPVGRYYYLRVDTRTLDRDWPGDAAVIDRGSNERWFGRSQGDGSYQDSALGMRFLTPRDRAAYLADGGSLEPVAQPPLAPLATGETGSSERPDAAFVARIPVDVDALTVFLRDQVPITSRSGSLSAGNIEDWVVATLRLPWVTPEQRGALIQVLGRLPGGWTVVGRDRVAGIEGITLQRPDGAGRSDRGLTAEITVTTEAPGFLRSRSYLRDPSDLPVMYRGIPVGSVVQESKVAAFGVVDRDQERPAD